MLARLEKLPVTVRLPLIAATMIFVAAVASTQAAIFFMARQSDRQIETLGQVYLDGLSAAISPYAASREESGIRAALERALAFQEGVVDRRLVFVTAGGSVIQAAHDGIAVENAFPIDLQQSPEGFSRGDDGTIWIWRQLDVGSMERGTVIANLDTSPFDADRWLLRWALLLSDLLFSGACAVVGRYR